MRACAWLVVLSLACATAVVSPGGCGNSADHAFEVATFRRCTSDGDCLRDPYLRRLPGAVFPPLCIQGMCQLASTHRCTGDADCVDMEVGCLELYWSPGDFVCEPPVRSGIVGCMNDACLSVVCVDGRCCRPEGADPNYYICVGGVCAVYPPGLRGQCDPPEVGLSCAVGLP